MGVLEASKTTLSERSSHVSYRPQQTPPPSSQELKSYWNDYETWNININIKNITNSIIPEILLKMPPHRGGGGPGRGGGVARLGNCAYCSIIPFLGVKTWQFNAGLYLASLSNDTYIKLVKYVCSHIIICIVAQGHKHRWFERKRR